MRRMIVLLFALALALGALPAAASPRELAPLHRAQGEVVEGAYIVVMKPGRAAGQAAERAGVRPTHVYAHALDGFAARMSPRQLEAVRRNPNVDFVEEDQVARADGAPADGDASDGEVGATNHNIQFDPPWNLDRIDQREPPLDRMYRWHDDGTGVDAYVLGTGIHPTHPDFGGRVYAGYDAFGGNSWDCNGHGTAVASVVGGTHHGAAKNVNLWSVRVLNCSGSGSYSGIIAGTDWVRGHAAARSDYPAVANYSFGGGYSQSFNAVVDNLAASGVFVAAAAWGSDPCASSPGNAARVLTVGAINGWDDAATPRGRCVDLFAPGISIPVATPSGQGWMSSTAVAAPHATGVAALYLSDPGRPPSQARQWLIDNATRIGWSNPVLLLYKADL